MKKYHLQILTAALTLIGLGVFFYKAFFLGYPLTPDETESRWLVEARLTFNAKNKPVKASLNIPKTTKKFSVVEENFVSRGYGLKKDLMDDGTTKAVWTKRKPIGLQSLYYRAVIGEGGYESQFAISQAELGVSEGAKKEAMRSLISDARQKSADTETFVTSLLTQLQSRHSDIKLICGTKVNSETRSKCAVTILQEAGLNARVVHGIYLKATRSAQIDHRVQVLDEKTWLTFDPNTGERTGRDNFLPWWYGDEDIVDVTNASQVRVSIAVEHIQEEALVAANKDASSFAPNIINFSLFALPVDTQRVYRVLLLVPVGALFVVILRNVIGFITFGTFMPVLIGLAFRETEMGWGIILFSMLVGLGLAARFYLERLKLLLIPRLSAILIIVVLIMAFSSVITYRLGIEKGISVALFPMVIVTMTIERMSIVWDELGSAAALKQALGTLVVACVIYLIICNSIVGHLVFVFPELLLVVLAMTLLLGRYSGYRLLELRRFRALAKNVDDQK